MSVKTTGRILNVLTWLCAIFNGILIIFMTCSIYLGNLFFLFGMSDTKVVSGSMMPKIEIGDVVTVSRVSKDDKIEVYMPGDADYKGIYVYRDDGHYNNGEPMLIIHRCIGVSKDGKYIFKGDANDSEDLYSVDRDHIVAKYEKTNKFIPTTTLYCCLLFAGEMVVIESLSFILKRKLKRAHFCNSDKENWQNI